MVTVTAHSIHQGENTEDLQLKKTEENLSRDSHEEAGEKCDLSRDTILSGVARCESKKMKNWEVGGIQK